MGDRVGEEGSVEGDAARADSEALGAARRDDPIAPVIDAPGGPGPQAADSIAIDEPLEPTDGKPERADDTSSARADVSGGDPVGGAAAPATVSPSGSRGRSAGNGVTVGNDATVGTVATVSDLESAGNIRTGEKAAESTDRALSRAGAREVAAAICPYLASAGGSWRMATPSREHRCIGMSPAVAQSTEKQRRHCLSAAHVECGIYRAARDVRAATLAGGADPARIIAADAARRPVPRTAPILLEPPHLLDQAARLQLDRAPGQLALIALMVLAFAIVALSRISGSGPGGLASPSPSAVAAASSSQQVPSASVPVEPSASVSVASAPPSGAPVSSFRTTYTVKKGDSLNAIARRFKTTVSAIQKLNGLKSGPLRIGQVLKIP